MTKILVIDGDEAMARSLCINMRARGYEALACATGRDGLLLAARSHPDAVLLDPDLCDMDGLDVVGGLRGWSSVPILVLSHRNSPAAVIDALDAGSDDYLVKPFDLGEVFARVRALLRRTHGPAEVPIVTTEAFTIDLAARQAIAAGEEVHLTPTEWRLVEILVHNADRVVTRQTLLREVWGADYEAETQYLRVYLAQIRRKLEPVPHAPRYFVTHPGLGVRFKAQTVRPARSGSHAPAIDTAPEFELQRA